MKHKADQSGLGGGITRRDFIGSTLIGTGAALLGARCPAAAQGLGPSWTGYGGVGDYRFSNGNTADVVLAAHRMRDGRYGMELPNVVDTNEFFDVVVVGAGFAGMSAIYEFKKRKPDGTCLIMDNHPIFGGEAKQNEFDVDGYRLAGPQGSNDFEIPTPITDPSRPEAYQNAYDYWRELGLPDRFEFAEQVGGDKSIVFAQENFAPMYSDAFASVGYYFENEMTGGKGVWVKNIWQDDLKRAPLPERVKKDLLAWRDYGKNAPPLDAKRAAWLDSMTYAEFVEKEVGLGPEVLRYADQNIATGVFACTTEGLSGLLAAGGAADWPGKLKPIGFPGGNATLLRHFVKAVFPSAITGPRNFAAIANNPVNFAALDSPNSNLKMRLSATAVRVAHVGDPVTADHVTVVYEKGGTLFRVKAKGVVLAIGSWVAKHIATDVPADYAEAMANIFHGPILTVNVALHNWRFMDRLGISAARWFDGFGFFANIRQPMIIGDRPVPFDPDKPAVLTFYVPFLKPGPVAAQGPAGRMELYGTSYAEYERKITAHLTRLFGSSGFDARRDIAGIVLNRWGHALHSPQPGFYFGKDGKPSPYKVLRNRYARISFGHSELNGTDQSWETASAEGKRAMTQILGVI
jgi:spermidine dehydrogenase